MKSILFVTTSNLTTNPRCLKEVLLALELGFKPIVIACYLGNWSVANEEKLSKELLGVNIFYIDVTKRNFFDWLFASLVQKVCQKLFSSSKNLKLQAFALDKRALLLKKYLSKFEKEVDLVIAHNLGAFYPAYYFSTLHDIPLGIDIEDYHLGESTNKLVKKLVENHLSSVLLKTRYNSFAAPLIQKRMEEKIEGVSTANNICINNIFTEVEFKTSIYINNENHKLQIVWFSQNIDYERGLEHFFKGADSFRDAIEITLIGNSRIQFYDAEIKHRNYIKVHEPMMQSDLHQYLSNFDVGLAIEDINADENRNLCLTNKIWSYLQAGLYILASNTDAQKDFVSFHYSSARLCDLTNQSIIENINYLLKNIHILRAEKNNRIITAKQFCWEKESQKLILMWDSIQKMGFK